jgi:hypothetical protein
MPTSMVDSLNPTASVLAAALAIKGANGQDVNSVSAAAAV